MSHDSTVDDLRAALRSTVPDDLDVDDFRRRLDAALDRDAAPEGDAAPAGDADGNAAGEGAASAEVLDLTAVPSAARRGLRTSTRRTRFVLLASVAAVAAAVVSVVVVATPQSPPRLTGSTHPGTLSRSIRAGFFPGTRVLRVVDGIGLAEIRVPKVRVPAHYTYAAYSTCSGPGNMTLDGSGTVKGAGCRRSGGGVDGTTLPSDAPVMVDAGTRTRWQVAVVLEPEIRTNGSISSPADLALSATNTSFVQSGTGTRTVRFRGVGTAGPGTSYTVELVCRGSGVSLPDLDYTATDGPGHPYTRTCFAGYDYDWYLVTGKPADHLRVVAAPGTRWTIEVGGE